jgi:NTE family protein
MKGEAGITRTFCKRFNVKLTSEAGFTFGETSVSLFRFCFWVVTDSIPSTTSNIFTATIFLSLAGDSYIKSAATVDVEFYKKKPLEFFGQLC